MNKDIAEFVGILLGDGSIDTKYQNRVQITLNKAEIEYANYIIELARRNFKVKPLLRFRKVECALDIKIFNKKFIEFLTNKIGLVPAPKWGRAVIPDAFMEEHLARYVLRGYFDTDGSVIITNNNGTLYPRLEMKICPSPMCASFVKILNTSGFRFGAYQIGNGETRIQMNGQSQLQKWITTIGFSNPNHLKKIKGIARAGISESYSFEPATYPPSG
jgi:hypothetical protein